MQMREQVDERTKGPLPPWRKSTPFGCRRVSAGGDGPAPWAAPVVPPCLQWLEGDLLSPGVSSPPSQIHMLSTQCFGFKAVGLRLVKAWSFSLEDAVAPLTS